jgi:hypothetical protein
VIGEPLVNLEFHAIDLLELEDGLEVLRGHQPDLKLRVETKLRIFRRVVRKLRSAGHSFVRLDRAAALAG